MLRGSKEITALLIPKVGTGGTAAAEPEQGFSVEVFVPSRARRKETAPAL